MAMGSNFDFDRAHAEVKDYSEELVIMGARMWFCNFEGRREMYNSEGLRNFKIDIPDEALAQQMIQEGWNVSVRPPRDEFDTTRYQLKINVSFDPPFPRLMPKIFRVSDRDKTMVQLDEDSCKILDASDIISADLKIRARPWVDQATGAHRITAWLLDLYATVREDDLTAKYAAYEYPGEVPFK